MYNVAILLSVFNGEKYLEQLLDSLKSQKSVKIKLFVLDDSSNDKSLEIITKSKINFEILAKRGFKDPGKNFFYLIKKVPLNFDYYCFCDQDDVWFKNKTIYSINRLKFENAEIIGSSTIYTDEKLKIYSRSVIFNKKLSFSNALVQSITGGNTQLWTKKFQLIISKIKLSHPASHDWMLYQIATLLKVKYIYCKRPLILYRQHDKNNIGANTGFLNTLKRIINGLTGTYKEWNEMNWLHLNECTKIYNVDVKNKFILEEFYKIRKINNPFLKLYVVFIKLGIYRQTFKGNLMLMCATFLNKI